MGEIKKNIIDFGRLDFGGGDTCVCLSIGRETFGKEVEFFVFVALWFFYIRVTLLTVKRKK